MRQKKDLIQDVDPVGAGVQQRLPVRQRGQADVKVGAGRHVARFHLFHFTGDELHGRPGALGHIHLRDVAPQRLLHLVEQSEQHQHYQRQDRNGHQQLHDGESAPARRQNGVWKSRRSHC